MHLVEYLVVAPVPDITSRGLFFMIYLETNDYYYIGKCISAMSFIKFLFTQPKEYIYIYMKTARYRKGGERKTSCCYTGLEDSKCLCDYPFSILPPKISYMIFRR